MITQLSHLQPGDTGVITALHTTEQLLQHRLITIGFRIGKRVELIRKAIAKGPLHVRIGTTEIMLRRGDATVIDVIV